MAWYNKYRPTEFSEVIGQEIIKNVLENSLEQNRIKNAYLFSGPRGIGKTTLARIFANHLNQTKKNPEAKIDIIELDAASNTGIDNIRLLIESAENPPINGQYKIYIIDEVHMLSKAAMNALLKILEEPPEYLVFLLATTNPEKIIPTVLSRLTKFQLKNHSTEDIQKRLKEISVKEKLKIDDNALNIIAKRAEGSQRDAINLLETLASYGLDEYTQKEVSDLLGFTPIELLDSISQALISQKITKTLIQELETTGQDGSNLLSELLDYLLDQDLKGDSQYSLLIIPIAEIISLKLPLTSISSAIALVQAKLGEKKTLINLQQTTKTGNIYLEHTNNISQHQEIKFEENAQKKPNSKILYKKDEEKNNISTKLEPQENDIPTTSSSRLVAKVQTLNKRDLNFFIKSLTKEPDSPTILKMLIPDLLVEELQENKVKLTASNAIFLAQLKSPKLQKFICKKIESKFGISPNLEISERKENQINLNQESPDEEELIVVSNFDETNDVDQKLTNDNLQAGTIFYKVYKELPKNMDAKKYKVIDIIDKPDNKEIESYDFTKSKQNWESQTEEMFDFED